jgi:hypothetical protein
LSLLRLVCPMCDMLRRDVPLRAPSLISNSIYSTSVDDDMLNLASKAAPALGPTPRWSSCALGRSPGPAGSKRSFPPWSDFTIRVLRIEPPPGSDKKSGFHRSSIPASLRRNERIRQALEQLPSYLLVMEMASDRPTLLYRFLRRGDINVLVETLLQVETRKKGGGANKTIRSA